MLSVHSYTSCSTITWGYQPGKTVPFPVFVAQWPAWFLSFFVLYESYPLRAFVLLGFLNSKHVLTLNLACSIFETSFSCPVSIPKPQPLVSSSQRSAGRLRDSLSEQVGGWRGCGKKGRGLEDGGAERRGSPDTPIPQERTGRLGVTVMGRGHNEDTSLQQWGALSQTHTPTGRQTQVNTLLLCTHIPTGPHTHQITIKPLSWSCQRTSNRPQRHCETLTRRQLGVTVGTGFFLPQSLFDDSLGKKGQKFFLSPFSHRRCRAVKRPACSKIKWGVERIGLICKAIGCREGRKIITLCHKTKCLLNHFKQYRTMWCALSTKQKRKSSHGESSWTTKWNLISWSSSQRWVRLLGDLGGWAHPSTINKVTLGHYVAITWALSDNGHQRSRGEQPPLCY